MEMQRVVITISPEDLTTVLEAAKYLGFHFSTVYRWIKNGKLHPIHIAGQDYLSIAEVKKIKEAVTMEK